MSFIKSLFAFVLILVASVASAQNVKEREFEGMKYLEEIVTAEVPYGNSQKVKISAVLMKPIGDATKVYPLVVFSHGSQDGGIELYTEPRAMKFFIQKGYALLRPARKGFYLKGAERPAINPNDTESITCLELGGVASAMEDTTAIFKSLLTRKDLDFSKILLAGFSRGGFLSLSLAMQKFPGAVAVINFSGGWVGETCSGGMINTEGFKKFGQEVKIPTISFYGENDNYYSISHIRTNLEYLAKNQISESHTLPGGNHVILSKKEFWWPLAEKWLDEKVFPKAAQ